MRKARIEAAANLAEGKGVNNPGDAYVVGGSRVALQALARGARASGATKIGLLPVEVASHTRRLAKEIGRAHV